MSSKYLTATNQVLYKLVCSNWIPTMNYTSMNQRRLRFVYMLPHHDGFDFGKLVYDQIMAMVENTKTEKTRCIMFPTLIQQVLLFQRTITPELSMMNSLEFQSWSSRTLRLVEDLEQIQVQPVLKKTLIVPLLASKPFESA